jgi:hypothetical protein
LPDADITFDRLAHQQIAAPRFTAAADLVRWMGAVQAQDYAGSLWALGQRLRGATEREVEAAIAAKAIVRTWPMRGTLHFVPPADVRWMLRLLTPRVIAGSAGRYRQLGLDDASFARAGRVLGRALRGGGRLTRPEAYAVLDRGGVSPEGQRGIHILGHLAQKGLVCFGPRKERQHTFVLLDEWVPAAPDPPRDEALAILARRYFASHGPATLQDFAWWTGLLVKDAQRAIEAAGAAIVKEVRDGRPVWRGQGTVARRTRSPAAALLPPWDEYVVAYRDRSAAVGDLGGREQERLKVVGSALILVGGRVRGVWKRAVDASTARLAMELWRPTTRPERRALQEAAARYGRFVGRAVDVQLTGRPD